MLILPFGFTALVGMYYYKRSGLARGTIRLPSDGSLPNYQYYGGGTDTGVLATLASVPWFIVGVGGIAYEWVASRVEGVMAGAGGGPGARRGYRNVPVDEDAQILRFEDEE